MAEGKIYKAISQVMAEVKPVSKKETKGLNYAFRGIDDIYNAVNPIMAKHGVFNTLSVESKENREYKTASGSVWQNITLKVTYHFYCDDGSFVDVTVYGEGSDGGDKGTSKALSQAHKLALSQLLCLPFEAGEHKEVLEAVAKDVTKEQQKELSMADVVKAFPQELKDDLKAAGYTTLAMAYKAYQVCGGDLDALAQLCKEKKKK